MRRRIKINNKEKNLIIIVCFMLTFLLITSYSLFNTNLSINTKGNLKDNVWKFNYTGKIQKFTIPTTGTYKIETWGAQGESWAGNYGQTNGGYGGYATGILNLSKNYELYISVGGDGYHKSYNGGGIYNTGGGVNGGGATSIQNSLINDGTLKSYENNKENIIMVSGGGAGSEWTLSKTDHTPTGGSGGGFKGTNGLITPSLDLFGYGGTQTEGGHTITYDEIGYINSTSAKDTFDGSFGQGGHTENGDGGGQGGGGYYGGGAANLANGGGGGSGYVGNINLKEKHMACYKCEESTEESTKTISVTCSSEDPKEDCAKIGNGYARITLIKKE